MNNRTILSIDISNNPDLLRIVEEVKTSRKPRLLKKDSETLAVVMPVGTAVSPTKTRAKTKADYQAFLAALGSWKDIDADAMIANIYRAREEGNRPPIRP